MRPGPLHDLEARNQLTPADITTFLAANTFPIVAGSSATFVWRGQADAVSLRHGIYALPASPPLTRLQDSDLFYLQLDLPECSRVEYKFQVVIGNQSRMVEDPLNPVHSHDPFGTNSVVYGTGYEVPSWTRPDGDARPGTLEELTLRSKAWGRRERVTLYLPPRFRPSRRYPLVVVHDGGDYLDYAAMKTVLDNLIDRLDIPELVAAFTYPGDRLVEYANDERHARWITGELVPLLEREYPLLATPTGRCLMGASFGAVASLTTAARTPGFYGRLLLQSGSFAFTDIGQHKKSPVFDPVVRFVNAYRERPLRAAERAFVSAGIYEGLIYENRSIVPVLQSAGIDVKYVEARDGHNWENWRDRMREGLSWLYPGPFGFVYE